MISQLSQILNVVQTFPIGKTTLPIGGVPLFIRPGVIGLDLSFSTGEIPDSNTKIRVDVMVDRGHGWNVENLTEIRGGLVPKKRKWISEVIMKGGFQNRIKVFNGSKLKIIVIVENASVDGSLNLFEFRG